MGGVVVVDVAPRRDGALPLQQGLLVFAANNLRFATPANGCPRDLTARFGERHSGYVRDGDCTAVGSGTAD